MASVSQAIDGDVPPPPQPTQNQSLEVATSVAEMLQQYMALDDSPFQRQYIQTGRELAEIRSQLQRLTRLLIVNNVNLRGWSSKSSPQESDTCDEEHSVGESNSRSSKNRASDATDMFFDCVSRFSEYCTRDGPLDQVRSWLLGSPTSYFESRSTFYGEQYTSESSVGKIATAVAMVELPCTKTHCLQRYSLIYAETARLWRRVTVSVMVPKASQRSAPAKADIRKSESYALEILPWYLYEQLPGLLNGKTLYDTVTEVSLSVEEHATGRHIANTSNVVITEDLEEAGVCDEEIMLREIDHMGCPQYLESEVIVQKLLETNTFLVQVEGQTYIERKMPFSAAALRGENGVIEFYEQLKIAYALRDCEAVVNFVGVVLDDTRTHLKSYLQESPTLGCLGSLFAHAQLEGHWIQWSIRESWAKQIIAAMAKIHGKGFLVGILDTQSIFLRSDGSIVLSHRRDGHCYRHLISAEGDESPEADTIPIGPETNQRRSRDFCSDIYQLGFTLWKLGEHITCPWGHLCARNACTSVPRYSCKADHINPIGLLPCSDQEAPPFFDEVINRCRQADPKQRSTARDLLQYFNDTISTSPLELADLKFKYSNICNQPTCCSECGKKLGLATYYHCNICHLADFDLCQHCVSQGIHCCSKNHKLIKRRYEDGLKVSVS